MEITEKIKNRAKILFALYMLCLLWVVTLKCNLKLPIEESRYIYEKLTLSQRIYFFTGRFVNTDIPDAIVNVLIFIPLGLIFPFIRRKDACIFGALTGLLVSLAVEIFQILSCIGGFTYIDIINNSFGAFLGVALHFKLRDIASERKVLIALACGTVFGASLLTFAIVNTILNIDVYL